MAWARLISSSDRPATRAVLCLLALAFSAIGSACEIQTKGGARPAGAPVQPDAAGGSSAPSPAGSGSEPSWADPFEPERVSLHPLTQLVRSASGEESIEAYIELFDRFGHGVKALGTVVFELYESSPTGGGGGGGADQLRRWNIDLTDPEANARPYDRVTRTYRFTLLGIPEEIRATSRPVLRVRFNTPSGRQLTDMLPLAR